MLTKFMANAKKHSEADASCKQVLVRHNGPCFVWTGVESVARDVVV